MTNQKKDAYFLCRLNVIASAPVPYGGGNEAENGGGYDDNETAGWGEMPAPTSSERHRPSARACANEDASGDGGGGGARE